MRRLAPFFLGFGLLVVASGCAKHPLVQLVTDPASRKAAIREHVTLGVHASARAKASMLHAGASVQWMPADTLVVRLAPLTTTVAPRSAR